MTDAPPEHRVLVRSDGDQFAVIVDPPLGGENLDRSYHTHKEARGYAGGLRMVRGFKLVDQTGQEAAHGR